MLKASWLSREHRRTHCQGDPGTRWEGVHSRNRPGREGRGLAESQPAAQTPGGHGQTPDRDRQTHMDLLSWQLSLCCGSRRARWHQAASAHTYRSSCPSSKCYRGNTPGMGQVAAGGGLLACCLAVQHFPPWPCAGQCLLGLQMSFPWIICSTRSPLS